MRPDIPLWCISQQIEEGVVVEEEVLGVARLRPDHIGALNRITAEEYRLIRRGLAMRQMNSVNRNGQITYEIQTHDIIVSFSRVELDGKATWVSGQIGEFPTESHGRKADEHRSFKSG